MAACQVPGFNRTEQSPNLHWEKMLSIRTLLLKDVPWMHDEMTDEDSPSDVSTT